MTTATPPMLVPSPLRRPVALLVAFAAVMFVVLAARSAGTTSASRVDTRLDAVVDPLGTAHQWFVEHLVELGSPESVVAIACLLAAACLLLSRYRLAALALLGPGLTGLCTSLLKPALGRTIDGELAFPSGHTGGATSVALVAALLLIGVMRPGRAGALAILAVGAMLIGGGVAVALVASNAHYPTDTMGGFCTAVVVVCGGALLLDRVAAYGAPTR